MVGRNYEYGSTSRTYSKAEIEKKRLGAIIKRAGYKGGAAEVLRLLDSPGRSVGIRRQQRPALQVQVFTWTGTSNVPAIFTTGGSCLLLSAFAKGTPDYCRHTSETILYKVLIKMRLHIDQAFWGRCLKSKMDWWLVYDAAPTDKMPTTDDIFDRFYTTMPGLWMVKRDLSHRFIVKKSWCNVITVDGHDPSKNVITDKTFTAPSHIFVDSSKFYKKLGVRTEWKGGSSNGDITDIKKGALYIVGAPSYDFTVNVYAKFRIYFKSVGNQ